ncbi:MAG: Crp/Fnr family transcriptional regulator [Bacteroidales bacterium]|nr:Crp/Fnr family transcriptional regulator [Bacteroidales bacterium]
MKPLDYIKRFITISPEIEMKLTDMMREHSYRRGDIIRGAVNLSTYAFYIVEGSARLFYTQKGKEHTFSFSFASEFIMLSRFLIMRHPDTVAIQFLEPTKLLFIPHLKMKDLIKEAGIQPDEAAILFITTAMSQHMLTLEERLDVLQTLSAEERYRWAIRRYPRLADCANATQIASFLGVTKETIYRIRAGKYNR